MRKKPWERKPRHIGTGTFKATPRTYELIHEVLKSGRISYGEKSKRFEREFAALHGCRYGILSNSGTSSLQVALQAMKELHGWADGDEVIVPAMTFVATVNIVLHNRMKPVLVDVTWDDYGMDWRKIEPLINNRTRAIIPVHLFGQPCNMTKIGEMADYWGLRIIEDSCETMFATHSGIPVGALGDIGCFSLYNAHILTAGVGGIATTNNADYARMMRSLVNHGLDIQELNTDENFSPRPAIGRSFRFTHAGHSYRITEMEAALALAQLEERDRIIRGRRRNARHLTAGLEEIQSSYGKPLWHLPRVKAENTHAWMLYPIVLNHNLIAKRHFTTYLNKAGIETRDMMPIVRQPIYDWINPEDYPVANYIDQHGLYFGCHQDLTPDDIEYILQVVRGYVDEFIVS